MRRRRRRKCSAQFSPPAGTGPGLPETIEAIDSARVTTRILYIDAHPDDESAAVLTYLARGLHADVALLSLTRGEGGQNDLGPEQAPQLGLIRTQELLAATRGYGVKLFFTRARDFGFSKTPEETEKVWGDQVLEDMVRVIRTFRPNVVISNFGNVHSGHGHHQASGLLTPKALRRQPTRRCIPELRTRRFEAVVDRNGGRARSWIWIADRNRPQGYSVPIGDISPLYGKSYRQIGLDAFANHRTQGISAFLGSPFLRRPVGLMAESGFAVFDPGMLNMSLSCAGGRGLWARMRRKGKLLRFAEEGGPESCRRRQGCAGVEMEGGIGAGGQRGEQARIHLRRGKTQRGAHGVRFLTSSSVVKGHIDRALALAAGFEQTADADRAYVVAGEAFKVRVGRRCRPEVGCAFDAPALVLPDGSKQAGHADANTDETEFSVTLTSKTIAARPGSTRNLPEPAPLRRSPADADDRRIQIRCGTAGDAHRGDFDARGSCAVANGAGLHVDGRTEADRRSAGEKAGAIRCFAAGAFVCDAGAQGQRGVGCAAGLDRQPTGGSGRLTAQPTNTQSSL